jgi:hypothetical protein
MRNETSEKVIEKYLVDQIKARGGLCIKLLTNQFIGLPDRLILIPEHRIAFAELKSTGQKPRKIQVIVHNKIRALGFKVYVIDTIQGVHKLLNELNNVNGNELT